MSLFDGFENQAPKTQLKTFSGKWYPEMPVFSDPCEEFAWLEVYEAAHGIGMPDVEGAMGEVAKYLPMDADPSAANFLGKARLVAEGVITASEAARQLSSKKIILKRK